MGYMMLDKKLPAAPKYAEEEGETNGEAAV
jgi:hypothetical protein